MAHFAVLVAPADNLGSLVWLFILVFFYQILCKEKINCSYKPKFISERALEADYFESAVNVYKDLS
jgi:hypothetical protein